MKSRQGGSASPSPESETSLLKKVLQLAKLKRWKSAHFRPGRTSRGWRTAVQGDGKGFFDLILIRDRVVFAELKPDKGTQSQEQREWFWAAKDAGAEVYLWRPRDWDEIVRILE